VTEALLFDCDGTLVDSLPLYLKAWQAVLQDVAGLEVPVTWFQSKGGVTEEVLLQHMEQDFDCILDQKRILSRSREAVLDLMHSVSENTAVTDIVRAFRGKRPMGVVSNGTRGIVTAALKSTGLYDAFRVVVTVEDMPRPKPAPDGWLLAASRLGVHPDRCIVFEDSEQGLAAGMGAGMRTIDVRQKCPAPHEL
jgi:beta-phosphoglucomutase-like phosphatase (HAD superfamily)